MRNVMVTICGVALLAACGPKTIQPRAIGEITQPTSAVQSPSFGQTQFAAANCPSAGSINPQFNAIIPATSIDTALFDAAVLHFTNVSRCANGVAPLAGDPALGGAATLHSTDMASLNFFSHTSPVPGRQTLPDRLKGNGIGFTDAAENIALRSRLQMISGRSFTVTDRATCNFSYDGRQIQPHSYGSLAQAFVQAWEESPGHRQNLLDPRYTRLGSGGSFKPNERNCGDIVATQNFAA